MHKLNRPIRFIYFFIDIVLITFSFYEVYKFNPGLTPLNSDHIRLYLSIYFFWGVVLVFLLHNAQLYYTDRYLSVSGEWLRVGRCVLLASILTALFIFILKLDVFSRTVFLELNFALLLSLSAWRTIKRLYVRYLIRKGYANYNILIIGAGNAGLALVDETKVFPYLGMKTIGFLDDVRVGERSGIKILGKINDIEQVVKKYFIDEIYVTIPSERRISGEIIQKGTKFGKTMRAAAEHFGLPYSQVKLNYIGVIPLLTYFEETGNGVRNAVKRLLDISISGSILILFLPLFVFIACLIKMINEHPFFRMGVGTFMANFPKFLPTANISYAHNCYLQIWAKTGIFGLLSFMAFVVSLIYFGIKKFIISKDFLLLGLLSGAVGFLAHSFVEVNLYSLRLAVLFWVWVGLIVKRSYYL